MTTLSKRATPAQARVMRMIEGAARNAMTAHPDYGKMDPNKFARGIAKRATGTLTAQWPDVLALAKASDCRCGRISTSSAPEGGTNHRQPGRSQVTKGDGAVFSLHRHRAIRAAMALIGPEVGKAKRDGRDAERLIEALRLLSGRRGEGASGCGVQP